MPATYVFGSDFKVFLRDLLSDSVEEELENCSIFISIKSVLQEVVVFFLKPDSVAVCDDLAEKLKSQPGMPPKNCKQAPRM